MTEFTFQIMTYGCKVNQYESQSIREHWQKIGGQEVRGQEIGDQEINQKIDLNARPEMDADVSKKDEKQHIILVVGCAVTATGVSDARQMVRKIGREKPYARVIVTGCAASAEPQDFNFPHVIACIDQRAKWNLLKYHPLELPTEFEKRETIYPEFSIEGFERSRPVLKIQDGCSHFCSYCIVPYTRGPARSRPIEPSIAELKALLDAGYREIMISGINLRQYGAEKGNFWGFLRHVDEELGAQWQGKARLRLSSLEPAQIDNEALETLEQCRLVSPHLHLSLQSGSPTVLERMGREHYSPTDIIDKLQKVSTFWPTFALGADILMGFPGESETEVQETLDMIECLPMTYAHVFPYSIRPNTKAAKLTGHLEKSVRQNHAARVRESIDRKKQAFLEKMLTLESMWVSLDISETKFVGWNEYYVSCVVDAKEADHELKKVQPIEIKGDKLITKMI